MAESKNAAVARKLLAHAHTPQRFAARVTRFNRDHLNPYVNYRRPCFLADTAINAQGKQRNAIATKT